MTTRTPRHGRARRLAADPDGVAEAARVLRGGGLVALPTETVYGLAARADDPDAVARIYAAKGRPSFNPLIVHVADAAMAAEVAEVAEVDAVARGLMDRFWPGPLTLVLPARRGLAQAVTAGLPTVAVRCPDGIARDVIRAVGVPLAAPSANPSGRVSPTTAAHVLDGLGDRIDAVLDGGPCAVGIESTILRVHPPTLLREGGLAAEEVEAALGHPLERDTTPGRVAAPGQMGSHYAPKAAVRLGVAVRAPDAVFVGYGTAQADVLLSEAGDPVEAAARLFAALRAADDIATARGLSRIDVAPVPEEGLGRAVNDRLRRAAAPRG
ncbi:L-threonylcarbamoyladenylate synthase [Jannaschia sp. Os4]|uniref:L-threonylcarbamoyladenylate synthase n=1 Tax=Jannaschia sp. Os4 TaxID=2807617 RepID=UPI0031B58A31